MNKTGFGFLRLPMKEVDGISQVNDELLCQMVDEFIKFGGTYFDTAYTYLNGESEKAVRRCLSSRYSREAYQLADKLPVWQLKSYEDCQRIYKIQKERCGVDHFDVYLLHWLNKSNYKCAEKIQAFDFLAHLKESNQTQKIGFSYHDSAELLDEILTKHPEVDIVQLQINYLDWESASIQSKKCYEVACKHQKEIVVMEPVKGGTLADLPEEASLLLKQARPHDSIASWAIRFVASLDQVSTVLSGMNTLDQIYDNMKAMEKMSKEELQLLKQVCRSKNQKTAIACTNCRYCVSHCPQQIAIPDYFKLFNEIKRNPQDDWKIEPIYYELTTHFGKASVCIGCKMCERNCPQQLSITQYLKEISAQFES